MKGMMFMVGILVMGCEPAPIEVYESVRHAVEQKDRSLFVSYLDPQSQAIFEGLEGIADRTSSRLQYPFRLEALSAWGEPVSEEIAGDRAIVKTGEGDRSETLYFRLTERSWRLVGVRLPGFWRVE